MLVKEAIHFAMHVVLTIWVLALVTVAASAAEAPRFGFPAACQLGKTCWAVNYFDVDPTPEAADFRCGTRTYDGHNGTDFAVRDAATMEKSVDVLSAADGTVLRTRDGVVDRAPTKADLAKIRAEKKGCGNGVLIDHRNGWQSIYCHMRQGSIAVKPGQKLQSGDVIGQIGQSGAAEFPHLHFGVMRAGKDVDPFTGLVRSAGCGASNIQPLWQPSLPYAPFALYAAGFSPGAADFKQIQKDASSPANLRREDLSALSFWMVYYGAARGDNIRIEVTGPDGRVFVARDFVQEKSRARQFYFTGKKVRGDELLPGVYTGKARLVRGGREVLQGEIVETVTLQ
jgi:hypothetical protein